ncbi:MAG TPA: LacI family transcriptional regulator [Thermotogaceae bacterium]|nr:LacI family transcriptional regulator [Thermotogaceae bacterium]
MTVRIKEVAKLAKVSVATVSRVLNNSGYVSTKTKERVLKAIEELNYQPTKIARLLARKKSNFKVALVAGEWVRKAMVSKLDEFYVVIFKAIDDFAKDHKMKIQIMAPEDEISLNKIDGFLLVGGEINHKIVNKFKNTGKPMVLVDQYIAGLRIDSVISDGFDGALYATNYLISKGLRKIIMIHGSLTHFSFRDRFNGYKTAMEQNGFLPRSYEFNEREDNMSMIIDMILNTHGKPDAIFGANDTAALRAMEELKKRGFKIPEDVSIVGFDDILSASISTPKLTTLKIFKYELGSIAVRRLFNLMMGEETHPVKISLFTEFIKRESTI